MTVEVWVDGRLRVASLLASVEDRQKVERLLMEQFDACWKPLAEEAACQAGAVISYGARGPKARDRAEAARNDLFH